MRLLFILLLFFKASIFSLELKVGMELSYPPFEMMGVDGKPKGISPTIAEALAKDLDRTLYIDHIPFIGLIPALNQGKVDVVISSMTVTPERSRAIDFSVPYAKIGLCLLASVNSTLNSIKDANQADRTIVVKSGTSGELYARKNLPLAKVLVLDKEAACVLEVVQGKADAFIYDQLSVFTNNQKYPEKTRALLEPFQIESWAMGVRKNNEELLGKINDFIEKFKNEGGFERIGDEFLSEQKAAFKERGIPFVF